MYVFCITLYHVSFLFFRQAISDTDAIVIIDVQHPDLISIKPSNFTIRSDGEWIIFVNGLNAGHSVVSTNVTPSNITE